LEAVPCSHLDAPLGSASEFALEPGGLMLLSSFRPNSLCSHLMMSFSSLDNFLSNKHWSSQIFLTRSLAAWPVSTFTFSRFFFLGFSSSFFSLIDIPFLASSSSCSFAALALMTLSPVERACVHRLVFVSLVQGEGL
ncbi:hypothetical protein PFISCL1PPCAC_7855, partial [Pristionchus fissidentatus]